MAPDQPDLMSYCDPSWVSDYHFTNALRFRLRDERAAHTSLSAQKSLIVSGHAGADSTLHLDPAFVVHVPPVVPDAAGPYGLTARRLDGSELFSFAFDMQQLAHGDGRSSFIFALPVQPTWESELVSLVLSGPHGEVEIRERSEPPMAILRDPQTGEVRAILRNLPDLRAGSLADMNLGTTTRASALDVMISHGLPTRRDWRR